MSDNYQAILNHLLFHKALISESEGGQRINRYLAMLNEIDQGLHVAVRDPFEKSVVAAFELALEKQLDPWEINLVPFTKLFLEKVRKDGAVNFVTAGKLVFLAWSILKMQSDKVLLDAMPPPPKPIRDRTGDDGLADAGIGDRKAHDLRCREEHAQLHAPALGELQRVADQVVRPTPALCRELGREQLEDVGVVGGGRQDRDRRDAGGDRGPQIPPHRLRIEPELRRDPLLRQALAS